MTALYIIGALSVFISGFSLGVVWATWRMAALVERVTDEALKQTRGWAP